SLVAFPLTSRPAAPPSRAAPILQHDPGLAASPPVRYTTRVARSEISSPAWPAAVLPEVVAPRERWAKLAAVPLDRPPARVESTWNVRKQFDRNGGEVE